MDLMIRCAAPHLFTLNARIELNSDNWLENKHNRWRRTDESKGGNTSQAHSIGSFDQYLHNKEKNILQKLFTGNQRAIRWEEECSKTMAIFTSALDFNLITVIKYIF